MQKLLILAIALTVAISANAGFLGSKSVAENTDAPNKDYDTVNGSVSIGGNSKVGDLSTVNGSVKVDALSTIGTAETVNGSIVLKDGVKAESVETVNGSIKLGEGCYIEKNVETVNGSIITQSSSEIGGDIETVNGKISITNTLVKGSITAVNGKILVLDQSVVSGDIVIKKSNGFFNSSKNKKPIVVLGKNVIVEGSLEFAKPVKLYVHESVEIDSDINNAEVETFSGDLPKSFEK
jgi:DUF4097 and DUF4098 domain-containing protein YvlB